MSLAFTGEIEYIKYIRSLTSRPLGRPPGSLLKKLSKANVQLKHADRYALLTLGKVDATFANVGEKCQLSTPCHCQSWKKCTSSLAVAGSPVLRACA